MISPLAQVTKPDDELCPAVCPDVNKRLDLVRVRKSAGFGLITFMFHQSFLRCVTIKMIL